MKIAMPVYEQSIQSDICPSFGRTPYFLIYDVEKKTPEFISNGAASSQGGAGVKAAQILVDQGVNALISPRCGENAAVILQQAKIELYRFIPGTAQRNVNEFIAGSLEKLVVSPGYHGHES
jgi:predicted Fe-Mo cluster-binding NifX family protein